MTDTTRIVVTGGPGGGKTTALDLFRREIGERVVVVPESATLLFAGGFPGSGEVAALRSAQAAIFAVQRNLEDAQSALFPGRVLLCDRGTVDGAAYSPGPPDDYFTAMGTTLQAELLRYRAVLFFETAAAGGHAIESGNPQRTESQAQAVRLDESLRNIWREHPNLCVIHNSESFFDKVTRGVLELKRIFEQNGHGSGAH